MSDEVPNKVIEANIDQTEHHNRHNHSAYSSQTAKKAIAPRLDVRRE